MQVFPTMIKNDGIIRLKVAAICTCLDTLIYNSDEDEEEIAPFLAIVEKKYFNFHSRLEHVSQSAVEPHAYLYLAPTGSLAELVERVLTGLRHAITSRELEPVAIKIDLASGTINAEETWIRTKDFYRWCRTRDLEVDDICARYDDAEQNICSRVDDWIYEERRAFEAPYFDATYVDRQRALPGVASFHEKYYESLERENILLKMGMDPSLGDPFAQTTGDVGPIDKPLRATERNALLSIIAVLCADSGFDTERAAKTAAIIKNRADFAGIDLGETTVENHLKKIPDAITRRLRSVTK